MHEQHLRAAADLAVGDLAGADLEHPIRCAAEQLGSCCRVQVTHDALPNVVMTTHQETRCSSRYNQGMGPKHSAEDFLAAALELALAEGLGAVTFGRVASQLGTNDRTVVYYFATKNDLLAAVMQALGQRLQDALAQAFDAPGADHRALLRKAWPVLAQPEADTAFALFFEAVGYAVVGTAPYRDLIAVVMEQWIEWLEGFLAGDPARRRAEAETVIAVMDGLLLLRQLRGPEAAQRAAARLGLTSPRPR